MKTTHKQTRGFSLIELVIVVVIIAIIAAIAVPKLSRGATGATDAALQQDLAQMRSAIDLFATEHGGTYPSGTPTNISNQLTQYSDVTGATLNATKTASCIYGPYLKAIPALPVGANKGSSALTITGPVGTGASGWFYDTTTNSIFANTSTGAAEQDAKGTLYNTY